jgi:hypothetical protein
MQNISRVASKAVRHGDLLFVQIKSLPKGLKEKKTKIIMNGTHGHDHSFENGKLYLQEKDNFVIGYFEALKDCKLFHLEHGQDVGRVDGLREAVLPVGLYELRVQHEDTNEGMVQVLD